MPSYQTTFTITKPGHLGGNSWKLNNLSEITVLFGKNGTGKSLLLRNLRDQKKESYHYASPERAGEISFNANYMQEEFAFDTRAGKRTRNLAPTYREEVIARIQAYLAKRGNVRTADHKANPEELEGILHLLLPEFNFVIKGGNPPFELTRSLTGEKITSVNELSSGESEVMTLALDLLLICAIWELEGQQDCLLLIDEPDTHLHPDLQQHLAKFLVTLVDRYQVQMIVSTHSTTLLSALGYHGKEKTSVVYLNNAVEEQKTIKFDTALQELSTCLGGHALMGPLFGSPLLLVEGDDDYKIWSQVPRHGIVKLAAIPCNGDEIDRYRKLLETIFASLLPGASSPSGFILKDGDKRCNNTGFTHIKCLRLSCHESENLYLTDEVLQQIGITWEDAKVKIKQEANKYGSKQAQLQSVDSWERKSEDIKKIIAEIALILDEKGVPWTLRVGKALGEKKPEGQLADFLGEDVVNSFWPQS